MSQQSGANAVLIFDTETTYKTTPVSPDAHVLPFTTESLRLNRNLISSDTIRSNRNPQAPVRGNVDVSGDINFELSPQYGKLFKHIFGSYGVAGGSAPYTHTYKIGALPVGMCIEKQFTDLASDKYFLYNGCRVNSFKLAAKPEGMIDCSVSILGAKETIGSSTFDATATDNGHTPFDGFEGSVKRGGSSLGTVTEIDFTLENNLDGNTYVLDGTGQRYSLPEGRAKVTGNLKILFEDDTLYALALAHTETTLEIHCTKGAGTGASAGNEKMSFYFDEVIFKPQSPVIQGPTGLLVELPFEAYYNDDADASALRMVLLSPIGTF
ncbi:MAG: hypothetical protein KBG09_06365 [Syntrophobacterales bacterium]|nr:hypothetical protein [Syntrophobacterales bacterium]